MRLNEMMHEYPVCCHEFTTAFQAAKIMREQNTGVLPVIEKDSSGKLIGIITDRDLCLRVVGEGRDPKLTKVYECMTSSPVSTETSDDLEYALMLMQQHQVRRIPIVDPQGRIRGMVTLNNLLTSLEPARIVQMLKAVSVPKPKPLHAQSK